MTAAVSKPRKKRARQLKSFDTTYLRTAGRRVDHDDNGDTPRGVRTVVEGAGSFDSFNDDPLYRELLEEHQRANPTELEKKVEVFFRRVENVTVHILSRLSVFATRVVKKYEGR